MTMVPPPSVRGKALFATGLVAANAVPGALVWSALGTILGAIPQQIAIAMSVCYAIVYGSVEALGWPLRAPGLEWQVPSNWLRDRGLAARVAIWVGILGPGIVTRNPFAGMGFLATLLAMTTGPTAGAATGAGIGLVHGVTRAIGVLRDQAQRSPTLPWKLVLVRARWRTADGLVMLWAAGALLAGAIWAGFP